MACKCRVHFCNKTSAKNEYCSDCTKQLYHIIKDGKDANEKAIADWISSRKLAGHVIFIFNRVLSSSNATDSSMKIYLTASIRQLRELSAHISLIKEAELEIFHSKLASRLMAITV